ncbi:site-specific DNA-methyltransferase [Sulfurovum sp.]|uniref:DNA-methyltransferase n=1 Tax=Sulfurovum sp. TaxID=1969726 RepID=UPI00356259C2
MGETLLLGDCLEVMNQIPDGSIDMVLADPPYGTTACKWDSVIDLTLMWEQLKRMIKPNGVIVMTACQPFTTTLIASNMKMFKYCWVWNKRIGSNFASASRMPLKIVEDIVVFGGGKYYPQKVKGKLRMKGGGKQFVGVYGDNNKDKVAEPYLSDEYHPTNIIDISNAARKGKKHPTQKPVALMEYLVKTYTTEGETVLDFTMGSGTTGVACANLGRDFVGIELDEGYFGIAKQRIQAVELGLNDIG